MAKLTLYLTRCGRWPGGATSELSKDLPSAGRSCETCLRIIARLTDAGNFAALGDLTWIRKSPRLSWHVLIPTWANADPRLLPKATAMILPDGGATAGVTVTFSNGAGIPGPARNVGESDADYLARIGRT